MEIRRLVDNDTASLPAHERAGDTPDQCHDAAAPTQNVESPRPSEEAHTQEHQEPTSTVTAGSGADDEIASSATSDPSQVAVLADNETSEPRSDRPSTSHPPTEASDSRPSDHEPSSSTSGDVAAARYGTDSDSLLPPRTADAASVNAPSSSSFSVDLSIDTDSSDADSGMGSFRAQSSSMSATSSIFNFVEEHGRTWHRYKEGKYFMPNDIDEQERLELQHSISLRLLGALYLAPVDRPHRVLDLGTGTGIWAIDFATEHPESDVLGTDLSPIQPEYVPPNCRFEVDDAEDEWVFSYPFDFIHSRYMSGSFGDFPAIFAMCYRNLNPGGWIEFQDYVVELRAVDDSLRGTALERWNGLVIEGVRRLGKNANACLQYKRQMREAGFVDVREDKFALPGNPWARGEDQKILGTMQMENILDGLHGFSIGLFTKMLGMSAEEVELLLVDVRKDLRNTKIHFYYLVYSVYGRKPF